MPLTTQKLSFPHMAINILEVCKVMPPPDSPMEMYLPLTFFDLLFSLSSPVEHLYFYEDPLIFPTSKLIPELKHSLSLTLKHFIPFAGNVTWPHSSSKPFLSYKKGDGISLTIAQSDADFHHLSSKNLRESRNLHSLVAHLAGSDSVSPLMAVKITIFSRKGFCIGITNHVTACDGTGMALFLKTWASISKFGKSTEMVPEFNRDAIRKRFAELEILYTEILIKEKGASPFQSTPVLESGPALPESLQGTFLFSLLQILRLKEYVVSRLDDFKHNKEVKYASYVSTFVVTYAYVVLCMVKAKTIANNRVRVIFYYDCRGRLEPPVSVNYIGNCIGAFISYFNKEELLGKNGLMKIVNFIIMSIKGLENNGALRGAEEWLPSVIKEAADTESMEVFVSSSNRFGHQNMDFGWGRPLKTDIFEKGGVNFIDSVDGNGEKGMEVNLCLVKDEMEKFAYEFSLGLSAMMKQPLSAL